jgi:diguanylate cyclase (GGDEF)-like protein
MHAAVAFMPAVLFEVNPCCGIRMPMIRVMSLLAGQRRFTLWAAAICVLAGMFVLAVLRFEPMALQDGLSAQPLMRALTAVCFVIAGLSLLLYQVAPARASSRATLACVLAVILTALASAMLGQDLLGWDTGIGDAVERTVWSGADGSGGLMSGAAALVFMLIGSAMVLMRQQGRALWLGQSLAAMAFLLSLLSLLAYLFGADIDRVVPFSSMTFHTAGVFLVLGAGALTLRGGQGWISEFFQDTPSARSGRRYLVSTIVALPLMAQLRIIGQRELDWYDTYFGVAILSVGSIAVLAFLNWTAVRMGNVADRQLENLLRVNRTLSGINTLIVRVREKDELFRESCRVAVESGGFPWVWIATTEGGSPQLRLQASHGGNDALMADALQLLQAHGVDGGPGLLRQVMQSGAPAIVPSLRQHPAATDGEHRSLRLLHRTGLRSLVLLPLRDGGRVAGVMALHSEYSRFFDTQEMVLLDELAGDIGFAIGHIEKDATLDYLACYDPLTGLPNRTLFMERLGRLMQASGPQNRAVALVLGNIQRFRMINETFGRQAGDDLLRQLATRLGAAAALSEHVSRINADTFACCVAGEDMESLGHQIQSLFGAAVSRPFQCGEQSVMLEVTVAAAVHPPDGVDGETLMANAETALRKAKTSQSPFMYYEAAMNARVAETLRLEHRLRAALAHGHLELHYQPKVDFADQQVHSVEALMRWRDPERGLVPPGQFIPLMEEIGLIRQAGAWALGQAVTDMERWRAMGLQVPRCAVNVSAVQLRSKDFVDTVLHAIGGFSDQVCQLDIEITESLLMQDVVQTSRVLQTLQGLGVHVSVDDFGTGYSSLAYLARLPINALKIDRAFIMEMEQGEQGVTIVGSIISLAHALRLVVIAEGVETDAQASILRGLKCDLMQGYLFSRPVPFNAMADMLPRAAPAQTVVPSA